MSKTTIPTGGITDATIATGDLADDAVTAAKIADAVGLGKVLQVVQAVGSDAATGTGNSFAQKSTPTVAITPSSSSNKILLLGSIYGDPNTDYLMVTFGRVISGGATTTNLSGENYGFAMLNLNREDHIHIHHLDSPSTTSACNYYFYFRNDNGSTSVQLGHNTVRACITAIEVGA